MAPFNTQYPPETPLEGILDTLTENLAQNCTCREDWEKFEHAVGAVKMLATQLERNFISKEHARECLRDLWWGDEEG